MKNNCFFTKWIFSLACTMFGIALMYSSALGQFGTLQTPFGLYPQNFSTYGGTSFGSSPYQTPSYGAVLADPFSSFSGYIGSSLTSSVQPFGYQGTFGSGYFGGSVLYGGVPSYGGLTSLGLVSPGVSLTTTQGFSPSFFGTSFSPSISPSSWQSPIAVSLGQSYTPGGIPSSSFISPAFTVTNSLGFQQPSSWSSTPVGYGTNAYTSSYTPFGTSMAGSYPLSGYMPVMTGNYPAATSFGQTSPSSALWLPSSYILPSNPLQYPAVSYSDPFRTGFSTQPSYVSSSTQSTSTAAYSDYTPKLSALWQGTYTFYNKDLEEEIDGLVNLQLTQETNKYQINGYMTVTDWDVADEKKKGRVLGTVTYAAGSTEIDFINVLVKFYPELGDNDKPDENSTCYVWIFSGSFQFDMLQCSLYVGGPDDYCKTGTMVLARKTGP